MQLFLSVPADHARGPRYMAQVLASLHAVNGKPISFEYGVHGQTAGLFCRTGNSLATIIERQLAAAYPDIVIQRLPEAPFTTVQSFVAKAELRLIADIMPIGTCDAFADRLAHELNDPIAGLLGLLAAGANISVSSRIAIEITPAPRRRIREARRILDRYYKTTLHKNSRRTRRYLDAATSSRRTSRLRARLTAALRYRRRQLPPIESKSAYEKLDQPLYVARIYLTAAGATKAAAQRQLAQLAAAFAPFTVTSPAHFATVPHGANRRGALLTVEELAILFHPPTITVRTERMEQVRSRSFEPPAVLPSPNAPDAVVLGVTNFRRRQDHVALSGDDRFKHMYVCGKTGVGKSTLLLNLISQDIARAQGVAVIDPHGDLIAECLQRIPRTRTNDLVLFDPAEHPIAFNPLACRDPRQRPLVAAGVLSAMKKVFAIDEQNAPRLLYILRNVLLALVEQPDATLLNALRMLTDEPYRRRVVNRLGDPLVRSFWEQEFSGWNAKYRMEAVAPIQNKLGQFLTSPLIRHVFASGRNTLDLRRIMDKGQILLVNLSHGRLGEDSASLLGALLVTAIEQAAKSRANVPQADRRPFYLYADEFQTYASTESLAIILSQARKYGLSLCLANQLVDQMGESLAAHVFGNVGSLCVMQVGRSDAERLAEELGSDVRPDDLIALPKYTAVFRTLIDGEPTRPFSLRTSPPPAIARSHALPEQLINVSRRRQCVRP